MDDIKKVIVKSRRRSSTRAPRRASRAAEPEPRPGLRCRPSSRRAQRAFADPNQRRRHVESRPDELAKIFAAAGIDPKQAVVTTCGSGVTASILSLALAVLGQTNAAVYDGSWAEWGARRASLPIETGPAK